MKNSPPVLVSACLVGEKCRYDGKSSLCPPLLEKLAGKQILPVCPERLGGLKAPREPAEITGGDGPAVWKGTARVKNRRGEDVTEFFQQGAEKTWQLAWEKGCQEAVLKERSPSCGKNFIYDGSFQRKLRPGTGVTAALLRSKGVSLFTETEWPAGGSDDDWCKKS